MANSSTMADKLSAGTFGNDLSATERTAYQEGCDADLPAIGILAQKLHAGEQPSHAGSLETDPEKDATRDGSEAASLEGRLSHDLEKALPRTATATQPDQDDPNVVSWDGDDDPENPMNWSIKMKWLNIGVVSALTFLSPLASSFFAPGVPQLMRDFKSDSDTLATFVVSIYVLGFAFGPLVVAPASEIYGRRITYHVSNVGFIIFTVACAVAPSLSSLIVFRFFQGLFGVTPVTIGAGTIADLMPAEKRGSAMGIWALGPLLGPVVGPVAGGFLADAKGWRWIFWVLAIAVGAFAIMALIVLRETYPPTLLRHKAAKLRKETGNPDLRSKLDTGLSNKEFFLRAVYRPSKLMFLSPICSAMSFYMAFIYAVLYLLFTTFTYVFENKYGFSSSTVGLVYIGLGIGNFIGLAIIGFSSDRVMQSLAKKEGGDIKPEYRLPVLMYLGPCVPIGLFIYGWTAQNEIQWIVPIIGTCFVGVGLIAVFMCVNTYLVDAFTLYAASAMAANTILRSILGGLFPLFGLQMYNKLGYGWGNSLLAFIALALCPVPWVFYHYGERIRKHPKFQVQF